jgi:hypothetical protein
MRANAWIALALLVFAAACGGGDPAPAPFPAAAYETISSASGGYRIEVRTSPQPPTTGVLAVELRVRDAKGAPVDGLTIAATPVMPAHTHGASVRPSVTAKGGGVYVLDDVSLFMAGKWELRTKLTTASGEEDATITLDVR